jgi:hypothetical protein
VTGEADTLLIVAAAEIADLQAELEEAREALREARLGVSEARGFLMQTKHPLDLMDRMDEIQVRLNALSPNPEGEQWRDDLDVGPRPSPLECYCAARADEGHKLGDHTPTREKG